ncbi:MAG: protein N-lysine methyltransferase family protein [Gemmataceae bacterium]|nr:protein N-lysine methyltransferase family protein [Gemmataceae bacterium]MCI0740173.1 protein N-lysine methyltransferase family protein [Gemmataceae bacterium]
MNTQSFLAPAPELILARLGPTIHENVIVEGRIFVISRPSQSDKLLDDPAVAAASKADDYMPYWADLWPAARMLAKALLKEFTVGQTFLSAFSPFSSGRQECLPHMPALEIGCGLGLPGIVALSLGWKVTFSDYDACALRFAADNARLNGFHDFDILQLDWRQPPVDRQFPIILAADLVYELRNVEPLIAFIQKVLTPGGVCLLTDQDRVPAHAFRSGLDASGLPYTTRIVRAGEPGGRRLKGTLYHICKNV